MIAILTLIFVIAISMPVTKVATIALTHTGMSRDRDRFPPARFMQRQTV